MKRMKSHLTKVSLALLSAAFLLGCQGQGSEPVGPEGPQFDKKDADGNHNHGGDDGGGGALEVTFTTHVALTSPTFTTIAPTPVNHKLWASIRPEAMDPIQLTESIKLVRAAAYPRTKSGKVTEVEMYFFDEGGTGYGTGYLPVDPTPVSESFTLHIHADGVELRESKNSPPIGTVSIADAVYAPVS